MKDIFIQGGEKKFPSGVKLGEINTREDLLLLSVFTSH